MRGINGKEAMTGKLYDPSKYLGISQLSKIRKKCQGFLGISSGSESAMNELQIGNLIVSIERHQGKATLPRYLSE